MAKNNAAPVLPEGQMTNAPLFEGAAFEPPKTAQKLQSRTEGFWDEDSGIPVYGRLLFAREVTPKKGPSAGKVKRYFVFELLAATMLAANKDKNLPARRAEKGQMIAVWATPGLQDVNLKAGAFIWIKRNPESMYLDTGKGNPMKTYDIRTEGAGQKVQVLPFGEDAEEEKVATNSPLPF